VPFSMRWICCTNVGEMVEGGQVSLSFVAQVSGESRHGETFTSTQRVYSNADDGTPNANPKVSPELGPYVISARPMFDLSVGTTARSSIVTLDVGNGNGPEKGYYVYSTMRVSSPQRAGVEAIQQPFDFHSELTATKQAVDGDDYTSTGFEYYLLACQYNTIGYRGDVYGRESYGASNLTSYPIERKVIDSGICSGARTDTNDNASPYTMTFDQADLSGNRFPTEGFGNVDLSAGDYYYINMWARYFIPMRVVDNEDGNLDGTGSIYVKNTLKDFDPIGLSGGTNFGTDKEPGYNGLPMPDGSKSNNITFTDTNLYLTTSGSFADYAFKTNKDTGAGYTFFDPTSSHSGSGLLAPGQSFPNTLHFTNNGVNDLHNPRACVSFDNTTAKLTDRVNTGGTAGTYAYVGTYAGSGFDSSNYIVEYGHIDFTGDDTLDADHNGTNNYNDQTGRYEGDWTVQKAARCDDNATTWVSDPNLVAGGIDNVNMVRARLKDSASTIPLTTSQYIRFVTPLQIRDTFYGGPHDTKSIPIGTVIAQFGRARTDEWGPNWTPTDPHSYSPAPENSSSAGDRVTVSRTVPRLDSESLTPLAGSGQTAATLAGKPIVWKVTTAIQSLLDIPPQITNVKIIDELPPEASYNRDCTANYTDDNGDIIGTPAHLVEYNTDRNGDPKPGYTRLTWNLGTVTANTAIPDRVICTDSDSLSPTGTNVTNFAELSGDGLIGVDSQKTDTHTIKLEQAGSMQVSKKVDLTLDNANDTQVYTIAWSNFSPNLTVDAPVVIDVFPFNGDDAASSNRTPKSEYVGALQLLGPPSIEW